MDPLILYNCYGPLVLFQSTVKAPVAVPIRALIEGDGLGGTNWHTSLEMPILVQHRIVTGSVAADESVPKAVINAWLNPRMKVRGFLRVTNQ